MAYQGVFNGYEETEEKDPDGLLQKLEKHGVLERDHNLFVRDGRMLVQFVPDWADAESTQNLLNLKWDLIVQTDDGLEYYANETTGRKFALMKGLLSADMFNAVSFGNLHELTIPEEEGGKAFGFDGIMRRMKAEDRTRAVFNGADIPSPPFSREDELQTVIHKKAEFKKELIKELGLPESEFKNFFAGAVTRITDQKGIDRLVSALPALANIRGPDGQKVRIIILGTAVDIDEEGKRVEAALRALAKESGTKSPGHFGLL